MSKFAVIIDVIPDAGLRAVGTTPFEAPDAMLVPTAFVAVTVNVYSVPLVSPVTVIGFVVPVAVIPPGLDVTVYDVIGLPPSDAGAVKSTAAAVLPGTAVTIVGTPGAVAAGVTLLEAADGTLDPAVLTACTVNV